ncbi:MAG TPA: Fic family protein [Phnomibacter sp.]|nr:Fic family protein [Phnomibacter sp.]
MWKEVIRNIGEQILPLERLDEKKNRIVQMRPLPAAAIHRIQEALSIEWTYNSNSIEGNTLNLAETRAVLEDGITIKGKSLREHFEAVNHQEAIELVEVLAQPGFSLTENAVLDIHALVLDKIEKEFAGRYRNAGVRITGANFIPPNALKVPDLMAELVSWTNENPEGFHPLQIATAFHHRFIHIHPFFDGNGRTVRLLFNLLLMRDGYPPAIILRNDRKKYYDALNQANEGKYEKLCLLMSQALERSLDIYLSNLEDRAEDYKPIGSIVEEETAPYGFSQEYLSLLARRGKIEAYKEGKVWYTSKEAIDRYMENRLRKRIPGKP